MVKGATHSSVNFTCVVSVHRKAVVVDGNGVGREMRIGVPAVGEKRPQWMTVPSELSEARMRCTVTGCHTKTGVNDASGLGHERGRQDTQQTSFLCSRRPTHTFIRISNTRIV